LRDGPSIAYPYRFGRRIDLSGIVENRMADALIYDPSILHVIESQDREHDDTTDEKAGTDTDENRIPEPQAS